MKLDLVVCNLSVNGLEPAVDQIEKFQTCHRSPVFDLIGHNGQWHVQKQYLLLFQKIWNEFWQQ